MTTSAPTTTTNIVRFDHDRPLWRRTLMTRESAIIGLLAVVLIVASVTVNGFAQPLTYNYLLLDVAPILFIALPMTLVMTTGEIDLSVGSMAGLASVTTGALVQGGMPFEAAAFIALVVGVIGGAFNGFLVTTVGLPSLAVTIGSLALFRGIAVGMLGTTAVTEFPEYWTALAKAKLAGTQIPWVVIPFLVLLVIFVVLFHFTPFGRGIFAVGQSKDAAHFSGVNVNRTKFIVFVLAGAVAALAGVYYTLRYGSARGDNATGLELQVIAAVVLGGVSVFGGRGRIHGVIAAVLLIGALSSALRLSGVTSDIINIITGGLLIVSVVGASLFAWVKSKRSTISPARVAASPAS
ncbi:ABC transporter permease [Microbacterium sp. JB110]|uniref:ABC transporter permease n=1 Tax=Microbacterium sp. JB110 TaxID=2024477 RepID=UPI00097F3BD6|nr:ABC transporter permease [Microbacterium sp. JB110]RCS60387.1 ABC transporter permease [Microbacterium sp. JB110]SJM49359.1 Predicted L-rhamnose ABC transporter, transmembrane component 1 [Frigoribacterium sp. JB110]